MSVSKTVTYYVTCDSCGETNPDYGEPLFDLGTLVDDGWRIDYADDGTAESAYCPDCVEEEIAQNVPGLGVFFQYLSVETLIAIREDIDPCLSSDQSAVAVNVALNHHSRTFLGDDEREEYYRRTKGFTR